MLTSILSPLKLNCKFGGYANISCKKFSAVRYCLRKTILLCLTCNQLDEAEDDRPNMFNSQYGVFNGATWENLCQLIFKRKYEKDDYQKIPASPGDFGLEGFTLVTGWGFQCYCPDKHYERKELFEKQRDKITSDLKKLRDFQKDLIARLGNTKLCKWIFVTPEYDKNELIKHARIKEKEIRDLNLPFLAKDFTILIRDADDYALEIK